MLKEPIKRRVKKEKELTMRMMEKRMKATRVIVKIKTEMMRKEKMKIVKTTTMKRLTREQK